MSETKVVPIRKRKRFIRPEVLDQAVADVTGQDDLKRKLVSAISQYTLFLDDAEAGHAVICVYGPSGCLAGETRVLTDRGQIPIRDLAGSVVPVWTPAGWAMAQVYAKGVAPLLKVRHSLGEFRATAEHRVLLAKQGTVRWLELGEVRTGESLLACAENHLRSIAEPVPSVRNVSAPNSLQIPLGFWGHCLPDSDPCGEPLRSVGAVVLEPAPPHSDARRHSGRRLEFEHAPLRESDHRAKPGSLLPNSLSLGQWESRTPVAISSPWYGIPPGLERSPTWSAQNLLALEAGRTIQEGDLPSFAATVLSVHPEPSETFYDIHVLDGWPVYWAGGIWHHNSGKTYTIEKLVKAAGLPFTITNSASISAPGIKGLTMRDVLVQHWKEHGTDYGIIFLDEIDKWCRGAIGPGAEELSSGLRCQAEILKYVQADKMTFVDEARDDEALEDVVFETSRILWILAGAFTGIEGIVRRHVNSHTPNEEIWPLCQPPDFERYGMLKELTNRVETWAWVKPLTQLQILQILQNQQRPRWIRRFKAIGCELDLDDGALGACAHEAFNQKTGARGAVSLLTRAMDDIFAETSRHKIKQIRIGAPEIRTGRISLPGSEATA